MPFTDAMKVMLIPQDGISPHVTANFNENRGNHLHGGVDFNYQGGQTGVNMTHPTIRSPVNGIVTFIGGRYGTISIIDASGNTHEILHTNSQNVQLGQRINVGDPIGTMGGRGPRSAYDYDQHVHYQIKDKYGLPINPQKWWDNQPNGGAGGIGNGEGAAGGIGRGGFTAAMAGLIVPPISYDPLVLDLDGDGIETTGARGDTVVLFDHDGDGIKTGTGWVKSDDGLLVLDRNGNGVIDSGRELFGDETIKSNGQLAKDGFDALKDLDANRDGKINVLDDVFANLRIWRDLNQDGVSQSDELTTLSANKIVSIGVNPTSTRVDLGNGNSQTAVGKFSISNDTGATLERSIGNLDLQSNTFYREFTDHIALTDQAKALPELRGSGRVRDLS